MKIKFQLEDAIPQLKPDFQHILVPILLERRLPPAVWDDQLFQGQKRDTLKVLFPLALLLVLQQDASFCPAASSIFAELFDVMEEVISSNNDL